MDIIKLFEERYSTKEFDSSKKLTNENLKDIETLLQTAISSHNLQPWKFIIATSEEAKQKLSKSAIEGYIVNKDRILDSSATIIFAAKTDLTQEYLDMILEKEEKDGRFLNEGFKTDMKKARDSFLQKVTSTNNVQNWSRQQLFINLGSFVVGVAGLGIDAIAMEGINKEVINKEFNLSEQGLETVLIISLGFRKENEFNATLPKSRLDKNDIISYV